MFWRKRTDKAAEPAPEAAGETVAADPLAPASESAAFANEARSADAPDAAPGSGSGDIEPQGIARAQLEGRIIDAISTVYDPEIPVNIYELGLIYDLHITSDNCVRIVMTLTSPACPMAGSLPGEVEARVREVEGVQDVALELVWDPPWTPERMSEAARLELGFM